MPDAVFETMAAPKRARDLRFAMVLNGEVETRLADDDGPAPKIARHSSSSADGCTFGEETLLHRDRRWPLLVRATSDSPVKLAIWRSQELDPVLMFDNLDFALEQEDRVRVLKTIFLFQTLAKSQLIRLAGALRTTTMAESQRVFSQGDAAVTHFYIIRTGLVAVDIDGRRKRTLGKGDYFGERALLGNEPRSATVTAVEEGELWMMDKGTFQEIMQGPCLEYLTSRIALQDTKLEFVDLDFLRVVGRGGFGVVKMVKARRTGTRYALKCMSKRDIVEKGQQETIVSERSVLAEVDHPFMVKYVRSFRTDTRIYFLMELVSGGELLDALDHMGLLTHQQAMFYTGSIVLALEFLHARRIAYLDLKNENCLIDRQGYLKLIDFGIAQRITAGRCHVMKGTPVFMAPEMILGKGYTTVADLWSLGVCLYDFVIGEFPFANGVSNCGEIFKQVVRAELKFPQWSEKEPRWEATVSLIRGLLNRDPVRRLGAGFEGSTTLKEHAFFRGLDWDRLLGRELSPPFLPSCETYAEDKEAPDQASRTALRPLQEVEAEVDPRDEGWQDPEPGWDGDF
jgi:cGMP-dependent protein kinase